MPSAAADIEGPPPSLLNGRSANERAVLSLLRLAGPTPSAEIARQTGLSAQSASVITRNLEADGLVLRDTPIRGKVGKPSTPIRLDPNGAFSVGLRLGRRRSDLVLLDLTGRVRGHIGGRYPYPTPERLLSFVEGGLADFVDALTPERQRRVAGIGVGMPFDLWNWLESVGAPREEMEAWRSFSPRQALARVTDLPVFVGNDSSLACHGEHLFGAAASFTDFAHIYMGAFVGGGIVVGNRLYPGQRGNAGAIASIPVPRGDGGVSQLLEVASVYQLERRLDARAPGTGQALLQSRHWQGFDDLLHEWVDETARFLAYAAVVLVSVLDLPVVVVDGSFPARVGATLVRRTRQHLQGMDTRGIHVPEIISGSLGTMACALGAGYQPIVARFLVE